MIATRTTRGIQGVSRLGDERGFNVVELALVLLTFLIVLGEGLPSMQAFLRSYQASGDAKGISSQLSLARMRSASDFTQARLRFNLTDKSYQLETFDKTSGQFQIEGGTQPLSGNDSYGYANISIPVGMQSSIGQPGACLGPGGQAISNSACILFNSRGTPVDSTGAVTSNNSIYLTNGTGGVYSVNVSPSGRVSVWHYTGSIWKEQ